ncbi:hypothetical protein FACS189454_10210 [Planctomycetales bacterium]|nr:hypothetical protein FACS189454_10210 [Planctomycetales bacterium]
MANEILMSISQDAIERAYFRSRRMFQMDMDHNAAVSRREGREEGIGIGRKEGEKAKSFDVARSMLADNFSTETIARYTGLSRSEIEGLQ